MVLNVGGVPSGVGSFDVETNSVTNSNGVDIIARGNPPLQPSIAAGVSIDIGFSASEFLSRGGEALLQRALRKLPIPSGASDKIVSQLKKRIDLAEQFARANNLDVNNLLKVEIDFPGNPYDWPSLQAWTDQTTLHLKTDPKLFKLLTAQQKVQFLMSVGGLNEPAAKAAIAAINFTADNVGDVRLILSPVNGLSGNDWEPRVGVIKAWDGVKGATADKLGTTFQRGPLGFISPRLWPDGTFQIIAGVAVDVTEKPASGKQSVFGDKTFVEYAAVVNLKFKRGDLIKLDDGTFGIRGKFNGQNAIIRIPSQVSEDIPTNFKDGAQPQSSVPETVIVDFENVAVEQIGSALDPRVVDAAKVAIRTGGPVFKVLETLAESVDAATDVGGALQSISDEAVRIGKIWAEEFDLIGFNGVTTIGGIGAGGYLDKGSHGPMANKVWAKRGNLNNTDLVKVVVTKFQGGNGAAAGAVLRELILQGRLSVNDVYNVIIPYSNMPETEILPGILTTTQTPWQKERANKILSDGFFSDITKTRQSPGDLKVRDIINRTDAREVRAIVKSAVDNGVDPYSIAIQGFALWQKAKASEGANFNAERKAVLGAVISDPRVSAADAVITGIFSSYDFSNRKDGLISMEMSGADISDWVNGRKFDPKAYLLEYGNRASKAITEGKDTWTQVKHSDGTTIDMPSKLAARYDRLAYFLVREGLDFNFGIPLLAKRIETLKSIINGSAGSLYDPSVLKEVANLRKQFGGEWKENPSQSTIRESLTGNTTVLRASLVDLLPSTAGVGNIGYGITNDRELPGEALRQAQKIADDDALAAVDAIIADEQKTLEQKRDAIAAKIAEGGTSSEMLATLNLKLQDIAAKVSRKGNLTQLKADANEALRIARESGNELGALLATLTNGVLDTLLAKVDDTTKDKAFAGEVNAISAAATAAGLSFSQFVQLIGRGDLAAFGAVIGDVGSVFKEANLGNTGSTIGAGFELIGNALTAIGTQKADKGLIIAGTAVNGIGGVIKASNTPGASTTDAGFRLAGNLAGTIGRLGNSKELQALGIGLNAVVDIPKLFNNYDPKTGAGKTDGSAALASTASQIAGLLIGGKTGELVANIGGLVSTGFEIAGNIKPGGAGSLYVTAARQLLSIVGVKLDAATNFALGTLSTALAGGPIGWAVWGVGVLFNLFSMGSFSKTSILAENIDADGDGKQDDMASLRNDFRRGFFGNVRQTGSTILYDVNGVDVRLLQNSQLTLTAEVLDQRINFNYGDGDTSINVNLNGQYLSGRLVDQEGRTVNANGYTYYDDSGYRPTQVFFEVGQDYQVLSNGSYGPSQYSGQKFAVRMESVDEGMPIWHLQQPTGNFVLNISASYAAINPSTAAINTAKTWVLSPADAATWRGIMGGDVATIGANDARVASGTLLGGALEQMTAQYRGQKNDPNLYMYLDMNGDGTADRVRVGLQTDGLKVKGDGKIQVWLLDAARQETGVGFMANNFVEAEEIGQMSGQLLQWGAGRPDLWSQGKDLGTLYVQARNTGALALMKEANTLTANTIAALFGGGTVDMDGAFARLGQINQALASPFSPSDYMTAHPDVAAWAGGDPAKAAQHYIQYGNNEGRALNKNGLTLAKAVIRSSFENGVLRAGETLISQNGQFFAVFQSDGNLVVYRGSPAIQGQAIWASGTNGKAAGGYAVMQADGNLVVYDSGNRARWASGTSASGVNRGFTLTMQDDGNLVVHDAKQGNEALWGSYNGRIARPEENTKPAAGWSDATALAYIASHQDLINAFGADANQGRNHFNIYGVNEGRQISFDGAAYMAAHPDVAAWAGGSPAKAAEHYIVHGVWEGRIPAAGQAARQVPRDQQMEKLPWLAQAYIASHSDLMNAFGNNGAAGLQHYRQYGSAEGRQITFNPWSYMAANPDVAAWAGNDATKAFQHFFENGRYEVRATTPGGAARTPDPRPLTGVALAGQTWLAGYANVGSSLAATGGVLRTGQMMISANNRFVTVMQTDGNLVNYEVNANGSMKRALWASGTNGKANGGFAVIQNDGNLVVYDTGNRARWASGTNGSGSNRPYDLIMQDDGNLVVYDTRQGGEALWSNYTGRIARPEANAA